MLPLLLGAPVRQTEDDTRITLKPKRSARQRVSALDIPEFWVQEYLRRDPARFGFDQVEGPFSRGPDFRARIGRRSVWVEVETRYRCYVEHLHHLNPAFDDVEILVVLQGGDPSVKVARHLPRRILHVDPKHFAAWYRRASRKWNGARPSPSHWAAAGEWIAGEFQRRWLGTCDDKDRDMAVCPDCDSCPYFGEGMGEARRAFLTMAARWLALHAGGTAPTFDAFFGEHLLVVDP
jgi:hypothetical protein